MAKKKPPEFIKAKPALERQMYVKIEVALPILERESYEDIAEGVCGSLDMLRNTGCAEVTEMYEVTNSQDDAFAIINERRKQGDISGEDLL